MQRRKGVNEGNPNHDRTAGGVCAEKAAHGIHVVEHGRTCK